MHTQQIADDIASNEPDNIRSAKAWAKKLDEEFGRQMREIVRDCLVTDSPKGTWVVSTVAYGPLIISALAIIGRSPNADFGLYFGFINAIVIPIVSNLTKLSIVQKERELEGVVSRAKFSFFGLDQYDRYLLAKLMLMQPGLIGVVKE